MKEDSVTLNVPTYRVGSTTHATHQAFPETSGTDAVVDETVANVVAIKAVTNGNGNDSVARGVANTAVAYGVTNNAFAHAVAVDANAYATANNAVTTFAVKTFGRMGHEVEALLAELVAATALRNLVRCLPSDRRRHFVTCGDGVHRFRL